MQAILGKLSKSMVATPTYMCMLHQSGLEIYVTDSEKTSNFTENIKLRKH